MDMETRTNSTPIALIEKLMSGEKISWITAYPVWTYKTIGLLTEMMCVEGEINT